MDAYRKINIHGASPEYSFILHQLTVQELSQSEVLPLHLIVLDAHYLLNSEISSIRNKNVPCSAVHVKNCLFFSPLNPPPVGHTARAAQVSHLASFK